MKTLVIYLMAGRQTPDLAEAAVEGGADIVELGFPFSDPLADGPVIQAAAQRAGHADRTQAAFAVGDALRPREDQHLLRLLLLGAAGIGHHRLHGHLVREHLVLWQLDFIGAHASQRILGRLDVLVGYDQHLDFDLELVAFSQQKGYSPTHPEVLRVNPKRQVPVLLDDDVELYDSTQIFEYCEDRWPEPALWPASVPERARARQLEHASDEVFFPFVSRLMGLRAKPDPVEHPDWITAREGIEGHYDQMEARLAGREYLAGPFTYADIAFYMAQFFAARHTVPLQARHANLLAWRRRVASRPAVRAVIDRMADYLRSIAYPVPPYD